MKILHLIIDHQVVERTMGIYEQTFKGYNDIIIFDLFNKPFKHLDKINTSKVVKLGKGVKEGKKMLFTQYTHIVAHFLTMDMIDFIKCAPSNIHVCWEIYGWDLYNQFQCQLGVKISYTDPSKYAKNNKYYFIERFLTPLYNFALHLKGVKYISNRSKKEHLDYIATRIDSIQACCKYDAVAVMKYANRDIPWFESFNYSLKETLGDLYDHPFNDNKDILIGNSASFSNNHFYVINKLNNTNFPDDCRIIMPISYGGNALYREDIKSVYREKYGSKVEFITDYMHLHEYNKLFLRLRSMILSSWRQESIGTVIMGLYLGVKVFMSEYSPLYKWMHECGFILKTIEDAKNIDFATPLTLEEKVHNRNLVLEKYSEDVFATTLNIHFYNGGDK